MEKIVPGLYLILWKEGGHSIGSIGLDKDGQNWMAPCNWIAGIPSYDWSKVLSVAKITPYVDTSLTTVHFGGCVTSHTQETEHGKT